VCTLALAFQQYGEWPLVVAANRDEALDRPAIGPFSWPKGFVAPRDERALGTWLGLTRTGLFVGVTNRFPTVRDAARESRGALVTWALEAPDAKALHLRLEAIDPTRFNAFHLVYADARDAFVTWSDGAALHRLTLQPGLHVVTERSFGGDDAPRVGVVRSHWPAKPEPEALQRVLRQKGPTPLDGTYVFAPDFNYGTRSSLVLLLSPKLEASRFFWAEGQPPNPPAFSERPDLVAALH
jgi:uncharacterized protein with NRDE domain